MASGKWKRWLRSVLIAAIVSVVFWTLILMIFEERFIFFPAVYPAGPYEAEQRALHAEDHWFKAEDSVQLHGWFLRSPDSLGTILYFHGNAGNLSHRGEILRRLRATGFNVFIFDYRGYGRSEGSPDEEGVYADGRAAVQYLKGLKGVDPQRLFFLGSSLGGAVAVDAATTHPPAGIILESTFSSARDVAASAYPFLPAQFLLRTRFDSESKIRGLQVPLLFFHGTDDSVIPYRLGRKLFDAANSPKQFVDIPGADHNDLFFVGGSGYLEQIRTFCLHASRTSSR
jgi:hypothetical protein